MGNGDNNSSSGSKNGRYPKVVLSASTLVPMVAGVILSLMTGTLYLERKFNSMERQMQTMQYAMDSQLQVIRSGLVNRWTSQDMKIWTQELKISNSALQIPDSSKIVKLRDIVLFDSPM